MSADHLENLRQETPSPTTPIDTTPAATTPSERTPVPSRRSSFWAPINFQSSNLRASTTANVRRASHRSSIVRDPADRDGADPEKGLRRSSLGRQNSAARNALGTIATYPPPKGLDRRGSRRLSKTLSHNTYGADRSHVERGEPPEHDLVRRFSTTDAELGRVDSRGSTASKREIRRMSSVVSHNTFGTDRSDVERGEPPTAEKVRRSSSGRRTSITRTSQERSRPPSAGEDAQRIVEEENEEEPPSEESTPSEEDKVILVGWENGDEDPMNPRSWSKMKKWSIVLICSVASFCVTCASTIYSLCYGQLMDEFHISREVATIGLSLFVAGLATGPLILAPLSEFYGRRPVYLVSYAMYIIWLIPSAAAQNIQTMLVGRFLAGFAGSAFLSVSGGSVGDLFIREELQEPMMMFTGAPFLGPALGPVIGGFINQYTHWRWTFYMLIIWSCANAIFIFLFVPETYHPALLRRKARSLRRETGDERYRAAMELKTVGILKAIRLSIYRPMQLLSQDFMVQILCLYSAVLLGILYLFFGAFPLVFRTNHSFALYQQGMTFLGLFIGMVLGILSDPLWARIYARLVARREAKTGEIGVTEPEYRLPPAIAGSVLVPIGLFWFGWTTFSSVHWIVPIIAGIPFGAGTILIYSGVFTFLVDGYPLYAASALGANLFARCGFAAAFPLFGVQMYERLGYQWATTLLGGLMLIMLPFPWLFYTKGKQFRAKSKFASADRGGASDEKKEQG